MESNTAVMNAQVFQGSAASDLNNMTV